MSSDGGEDLRGAIVTSRGAHDDGLRPIWGLGDGLNCGGARFVVDGPRGGLDEGSLGNGGSGGFNVGVLVDDSIAGGGLLTVRGGSDNLRVTTVRDTFGGSSLGGGSDGRDSGGGALDANGLGCSSAGLGTGDPGSGLVTGVRGNCDNFQHGGHGATSDNSMGKGISVFGVGCCVPRVGTGDGGGGLPADSNPGV
jgi:hypothetical protein